MGIGLLYQQGYFRQILADDGYQLEAFPYNDPDFLPVRPVLRENGDLCRVLLPLPGRTLRVRVWQAKIGRVSLYLLDTNDPLNSAWDRGITASLYDAGKEKRLLQEIVLGVGGWQALQTLGIDVDICHLNEGHAAFAVLARTATFSERHGVTPAAAFRATKAGNVFTTHTPVSAAFDVFDPSMVAQFAEPFLTTTGISADRVVALGRRDPANLREPFNMAYLAMHGCSRINGVSKLHGRVSRQMFSQLFPRWPVREVPVGAITNGVDCGTWNSSSARHLWCGSPEDLGPLADLESAAGRIRLTDPVRLWDLRGKSRLSLVEYVRGRLAHQLRVRGHTGDRVRRAAQVLDPNVLTLGFARRFTEYKRPNLLLTDGDRMKRLLLNPDRPAQLIVAGKAHPNDTYGKSMVRAMAQFAMQPELRDHVVFLEDYDIVLARHLASGVDVWLNTPRRPAEACGTSGMKILFNGGLNLSVRDGWWDEAYQPDVGWTIGDGEEDNPAVRDAREATEFYRQLEEHIVPEFYDRDPSGVPRKWLDRVRNSMSQLTPVFSSNRMVRDYVEQAYLPAAEAYERRAARDGALAVKIANWQRRLADTWPRIHFGDLRVSAGDGKLHFEIHAYLAELECDDVRVELYSDATGQADCIVVPCERTRSLPGSLNGFLYEATVPADRPAEDYTPRIVPFHPDAFVPLEESHILWRDRETTV
ncbi:MAG: alpha-glucan family phosphorylase [Planctomycetaceae bacterium]